MGNSMLNSTRQMIAATTSQTIQNRESPFLGSYISSGPSGGSDDLGYVSFISCRVAQNRSSYGPPMVVPPLTQQYEQPQRGYGAPHFHVRPICGGRGHLGELAQLQFLVRLDVALGGVEQVHAEDRFIRPQAEPVNARLGRS